MRTIRIRCLHARPPEWSDHTTVCWLGQQAAAAGGSIPLPHLAAPTLGLLAGAGFLAGGINAVAGGGSLVSFPALLLAGYSSLTANITNSVALLPGYAGGSIAYRRELQGQGDRSRELGAVSVAGAVAGAWLLVVGPAHV